MKGVIKRAVKWTLTVSTHIHRQPNRKEQCSTSMALFMTNCIKIFVFSKCPWLHFVLNNLWWKVPFWPWKVPLTKILTFSGTFCIRNWSNFLCQKYLKKSKFWKKKNSLWQNLKIHLFCFFNVDRRLRLMVDGRQSFSSRPKWMWLLSWCLWSIFAIQKKTVQ